MANTSILFVAFGNTNITAKHKNTLEFTSDEQVTIQGDCIAGCRLQIDWNTLFDLVKKYDYIGVHIDVNGEQFSFNSLVNRNFIDTKEIVFRRSEFESERTLGIRCDKACNNIPESIRILLLDPNTKIIGKLTFS